MKTIVFATNNANKLSEVQEMLEGLYEVKSLKEIGCLVDLPETQDTLEGNAKQKSQYVKEHFGYDCFADDTGLEIIALNGAPGVYSARYAGPQRSSEDNMNLVLKNLNDNKDRSARFKTMVSLELKGESYLFEGICEGVITKEKSGEKGFGYDPIFQPSGHLKTFAELTSSEKNEISHRGKAIEKLIDFLRENA